MKILFLGAAGNIHTVRWVNALSEKGHEVHLVSNGNHFKGVDSISLSVKIYKLRYSGSIGYYLNAGELNKIYNRINPDIVNAHYASGYGVLARRAKLRPLVLSVWGSDVYDFPYSGNFKKYILQKNLRYADKLASTSLSMSHQVEKVLGEKVSITVTPFGVNTEVFKPFKGEEDDNVVIFGVVKTLMKKYGLEYVIKAFKLLLDRLKSENNSKVIKLVIYGRGPLEQELKGLCKELKIDDHVSFKGYIKNTEVPSALNKMDVFCLGSILDSESFGVAAVEAMACEIPVIATDVSGFKEVMIDGVTGYIVPRENEHAIAEKMYELLKSKEMRVSMGKNGRRRVLAEYSWDNNVETMIQLYKNTIAKFNDNMKKHVE